MIIVFAKEVISSYISFKPAARLNSVDNNNLSDYNDGRESEFCAVAEEGIMQIIDAHAHCGLTLTYENIRGLWNDAGISGGVLFAPVEEIYDRYDPCFTDSPHYRRIREKVHNYLQSLMSERVFAYWFVWNDFILPPAGFKGIKWHRHADEPLYDYDSSRCREFIAYACEKKLPIILEEEFHNTLKMLDLINSRTTVIIPHFGMLNGGYYKLKKAGVFDNAAVYVDTALAAVSEMKDFAAEYGVSRILFGSDFPFGNPAREYWKVEQAFSGKDREKVAALNIRQLLE